MLGYAVHHCSVAVKHSPEEVSCSTVGQEGSEYLLLLKGHVTGQENGTSELTAY